MDYAPPACGELIFAATFEIKLDRKLKGYRHPFIYLVVPCLYRPERAETFLNRRVELTVTKQNENRQPCFYDRGNTPINSRGLPYYCAKRGDLLKAIESQSISGSVEPVEFEGALEKGSTYRALIACDQAGGWHTAVRLKFPYHHAARIEWVNLAEFPQLSTAKNSECQRRVVFRVVTKRTVKLSDRYRWNTTYECRILSVE